MLTSPLLHVIAASANGSGDNLATVSYVIGIMTAVIGFLAAAWKVNQNQKRKWQAEAIQRTEQEASIKENSRRLGENSKSNDKLSIEVSSLGDKIDRFADRVESQLNGHSKRLSALERWLPRPQHTPSEDDET